LNAAGIYDLPNTFTTKSGSSLVGFYARAGYDYRGKYLLNATIRRDGSSVFGFENRWGNFPSVSAGWRFSDESFFPKSWKNVLTDGKFRASWGITGNQEIGDYDAIVQYVFGSSFYNGISGVRTNSRLGNPLLKWESTTQTNFGLDLAFLNGRISFVGDYYIKLTEDLLYDSPIPTEVGFANVRTNFGSIENKGIELMLTAYPVRTKDFSWMTSVNYSQIRNELVSLPIEFIDDIWSLRVGQEAGNFFGYKYLGVYQYDQSNAYTEDFKTRLTPVFQQDALGNVIIQRNMQPILLGYTLPNGQPYTGPVRQKTALGVVSRGGDVIWEEVPDEKGEFNGNIGNEDRQFIGYGQPRWSLGWNNNISYKGFYLSANFYGNFGYKVYNEQRRLLQAQGVFNITPQAPFVYEMWKYPGQITDEFHGRDRNSDNMRRGSSQVLEDASFLRLQALRIGYQLPQKTAAKAKMRAVNVFLYGTNVFTWTSYTGFDPEVSQRSVIKPGNDPGRFPRRRELGFGANVSF
jgi:TonB-linked SusC/RagA family outer membrane protein